jgi:hypothetical protein
VTGEENLQASVLEQIFYVNSQSIFSKTLTVFATRLKSSTTSHIPPLSLCFLRYLVNTLLFRDIEYAGLLLRRNQAFLPSNKKSIEMRDIANMSSSASPFNFEEDVHESFSNNNILDIVSLLYRLTLYLANDGQETILRYQCEDFAASLDWDSDEDVSPEQDCTDSRGMPFHDPLPGSPADLAHEAPYHASNVAIEPPHSTSSNTSSTVSNCDQYPLFNGSANKQ